MSEKKENKHSYRAPSFYNIWRRCFQYFVTHMFYYPRFKFVYRFEVIGKENIPKHTNYIAAANHLSTLDPVLVTSCMPHPVAYMAKKELFDNFFMRCFLDWLGAFAVDREKLSVSTIKTVKGLNKTNWSFGIFPQGKRQAPGQISEVTKGFATLAKTMKYDILPMGIIGTDKVCHIPFTGKIIVRIGKPIPYSDNIDEVVEKWGKAVEELTGFEYIPNKK